MGSAARPRRAAAGALVAALLSAASLGAGCAQGLRPSSAHPSPSAPPSEEGTAPLTTAMPTPSVAAAGVRLLSRVPTTDRVVFVGIDDGIVRQPEVARMLAARHLPVSLFVIGGIAAEDPAYFRDLVAHGATVEDHTMDHPLLTRMSEERQRREICDSADRVAALFGRRPTLFRPPYGAYDAATLRAVHDCGMDTVVLWDVAVNDGVVQYQSGHELRPGDIVLMHFRRTGVQDLSALLAAVDAAGLRIASLEEAVAKLPPPAALPVVPALPAPRPTRRHVWHPATPTVGPVATTSAASPTRSPTATATAAATQTPTLVPTPTFSATPAPSPPPSTATSEPVTAAPTASSP